MKIEIIIAILFIHWIADFILQTDKMAIGKSKNWSDLLLHTATYSTSFWIVGLIYYIILYKEFPIQQVSLIPLFLFVVITFITHTVVDYITSRINSKLWQKNKRHDFFIVIGLDQLIHIIILIYTFDLLIN